MTTATSPTPIQQAHPPQHPGNLLTRRERLVYVLLLGALTALGPFTIDLYLPALPEIERDFDVSAGVVQATLAATTIGFAVGQLITGPWSDKIGRRLPLILATAVHVIASFGVALAPEPVSLLVFRLLQGVGAAAGSVVALAMVRDLFGGIPLVRMLANLSLVNGLAPIIAPLIGSQLLLVAPWRGLFWMLAGYGVVMVLGAAFFLRETLPPERRHVPGHTTVLQRYRAIFTDRVFVGVAIGGAMMWVSTFSYLANSPFLYQEVYGASAQEFGLIFAAGSIMVVSGVQVGSRLARRIGPQWVLLGSFITVILTGIAVLVCEAVGTGPVGVIVSIWVFIFALGTTFPCTQVLALVNHGAEAGTAASVLGAANFLLAGLLSPFTSLLGVDTALPIGGTITVAATLALIALLVVVRPRTVPPLTE